jgi:hypothetical protein
MMRGDDDAGVRQPYRQIATDSETMVAGPRCQHRGRKIEKHDDLFPLYILAALKLALTGFEDVRAERGSVPAQTIIRQTYNAISIVRIDLTGAEPKSDMFFEYPDLAFRFGQQANKRTVTRTRNAQRASDDLVGYEILAVAFGSDQERGAIRFD